MLAADVQTSSLGAAREHPISVDPRSDGLRVRYVLEVRGETMAVWQVLEAGPF